jgi:uncharacterized protein with ParB-like and HNH nuclease domain
MENTHFFTQFKVIKMANNPVYHNILNAFDADHESYNINPFTIYDFFNKSDIRRIPSYQRSYSWEKTQIEELLNDVLSISNNKNNSWFLGPIFSTKKAANDNGSELLDGQQRITTILLILREVFLFSFYLDPGTNLNSLSHSIINDLTTYKGKASNCLYIDKSGIDLPRFETEETSREFLDKIFKEAKSVTSKENLRAQKKAFEDEGNLILKEKGSKTAQNLVNSINTITSWLKQKFINNDEIEIETKLKSFNDFVYSLLYKCWLIEIPLKNERESINIFESINNRGKDLTLVDKIRFKTLTYLEETSGNFQEDLTYIKNSWKNIYIQLESLSSSIDNTARIFSSEDDFFQVYFNANTGLSLTSDHDRMDEFEKIINPNPESNKSELIRSFLDQITNILFLLNLIDRPLEGHDWIKGQINSNPSLKASEKSSSIEKTAALLHLTKSLITNLSKNSRILIFNLFEKIGTNDSLSSFQHGLYNINKIAFFTEIIQNEKSNIIRNKYLKYIKESKTKNNYYTKFFSQSNPDFTEFQSISTINPFNYILNKEDSESKYILHFTSFLEDYNMLSSGRATQHSKCHLEHFVPLKYNNHWPNIKPCYKDDLLKEIELIKSDVDLDSQIFDNSWFVLFTNQLATLSKFDITDEFQNPREESIIQFIGNKWVMESATNISISNNGFDKKKAKFYDVVDKIIIPTNNKAKIGMDSFNNFTYKEIFRRSIYLLQIVYKEYHLNYDDV